MYQSPGKFSYPKAAPVLIFLQVLSGKLPWSEVRMDARVIILLRQGDKPKRPESRPVDDQHWNFIQQCWSSIEERPAAEDIVPSIQHFLNHHPPAGPPRDLSLFTSWSSQDESKVTSSDPLLSPLGLTPIDDSTLEVEVSTDHNNK